MGNPGSMRAEEIKTMNRNVVTSQHYDDGLVLLRHRIGVVPAVLRGALQQGHRAKVVARATIRCRRIVAIEFVTCRSGRTGGASGSIILGNAKRREFIGGLAGS